MDETTDVLGFEARRCEAMITADFGALDQLLSDALTWTHASARQDDKASFLAGLRGGHTRYLEIRRSEERVHLHGEAAVVTGVADMRASIDGTERQLRNRYTNMWAKSDEGWQMVAWQSTAIPNAG